MKEVIDSEVLTLRGKPIRGGWSGEIQEGEVDVTFYIYRNGLGELRVGWDAPVGNLYVDGNRVHIPHLERDIIRNWLSSERPVAVMERKRRWRELAQAARGRRAETLYKKHLDHLDSLRFKDWIWDKDEEGVPVVVGIRYSDGWEAVVDDSDELSVEVKKDGVLVCVVRWIGVDYDGAEGIDVWRGSCGRYCPHWIIACRAYYTI